MRIIKRDGRETEFDRGKIVNAIKKAMAETELGIDSRLCYEIADDITFDVGELDYIPTVEVIQDMVEEYLMASCRKDVAKRYILYREERNQLRNKSWEMDELQRDIYENKYRFQGESFDDFLNRVSGGNQEIKKLIKNKDFAFAGRILAGRGVNKNVTLSNCYVLPAPEDNLESIFDTAKESARTYSYGGGVGFDITKLRPKGSPVNNAALTTSGAVSFMELYSTTTGIIGQKGRRGALMISMDVDHPDILDFINVKRDLDKVTNANISVKFNDDFFENMTTEKENILYEMAKGNWETGEPGALYWDKVRNWHWLEHHPEYVLNSTNPCGEQPLPDYGSCLLGSINLSNFVLNPFTDNAKIDNKRLVSVVQATVRGMNEVLDEGIPLHPLKRQQEVARDFRQIGLGVMGVADMFIKLGVRYGSPTSINLSRVLAKLIQETAILESVELAKKYGSYPEYDFDIISKSNYFKSLNPSVQKEVEKYGMRNSHILSIAPTGSISTMYGVSGGIEPIFATSYTRTTKSLGVEGDTEYKVYTPVIKELMEHKGITSEEDLPDYVVTSHDIPYRERIMVQSAWQEFIDSAISSTINLNEDATIEDIIDIYKLGWKYGLKGVTVFRNNCFRTGILKTEEKPKNVCPDCGGELMFTNGCNECGDCGFSACSL